MNQDPISKKQELVGSLLGLAGEPGRAVIKTAVVIVAIEVILVVLHFTVVELAASLDIRTEDGNIGAFDLGDEATMASWLSTIQLLVLGLLCLMISWFDRDGPRALPATWVWRYTAAVFVIMSIDEGSGLHEVFGKLMVVLLPEVPLTDRMWGMLPYGILLMLVFAGTALSLKPHGPLPLGVVLGALCWIVGQTVDQLQAFTRPVSVAIEEGLEMLGGTVLAVTFGLALIRLARSAGRVG